MSVFSNPEIIEILNRDFVPVAGNNWYHTRRKDDTGAFYHQVTNQGPRGNTKGTRQGHYIFSAAGKLLAYNNNRALDRRQAFIAEGLKNWAGLGVEERTAGGIEIPDESKVDDRYVVAPPEGGLVADVHSRLLVADPKAPGGMAPLTEAANQSGRGIHAAVDHFWMRAEEWRELVALGESPAASTHEGVLCPEWFRFRLARFHAFDNTRGEPPFWKVDEIREAAITLHRNGAGRYRLAGRFHLETSDGERGYQAALNGFFETGEEKVERFDLVILGNHWGQGPHTPEARPGRQPLGIAFRLSALAKPRDFLKPQGSHWMDGYWSPRH